MVDFCGNTMQQPAIKADVFPHRRMAHKAARYSVAARYVVASMLQYHSGSAGAAEVSDSADLGVCFDAM
jgi:hypothetical protein